MVEPYGRRVVDEEISELFTSIGAIAIGGPKGVGKTTTARQHSRAELRLDRPAVAQVLSADPESLLVQPRPLLIDEWQRVPAVWDVIRRAVDEDRVGGQFLLTGSATPREGATAHSGAGRIVRTRMRPLSFFERGISTSTVSLAELLEGGATVTGDSEVTLTRYVQEITASGLPGVRTLPPRARRAQLTGYVQNIVDRDIPDAGVTVRNPQALLHWLRAYGAAVSTTTTYTGILDAATAGVADKPAERTTLAYRDALEQIWILDPVPAWQPIGAELGRLATTPRHQLADPALATTLLGLSDSALMRGEGGEGNVLGNLYESLVTLSIRVLAQHSEATVSHFRDRNGDHEVDVIVANADGSLVGIEVKLSSTVDDRDVRHLKWLRERSGERMRDAIVVHTGPAAYRRPDGIGVVPLALLGP